MVVSLIASVLVVVDGEERIDYDTVQPIITKFFYTLSE